MSDGGRRRRVALVTGGTGTIGAAVCARLGDAGLDVAVQYRASREEAEAIARTVRAAGHGAAAVQADLREVPAVEALFREVREAIGPVAVLVNAVGAPADASLLAITRENWDAGLALNLTGQFECMRRAARDMIQAGWGRIVNVGSVAELVAWRGQGGYAAAKAGLTALSRVSARELARHGVTVNVVAPGLVGSSPAERMLSPRQRAEVLGRVPGGQPVTAAAVAAAIGFLCSEEAGMITGQVLAVDGGMSI
jgi:3-oxoacyl-[acyl-carrier protein] reductase